MSRNQVKATLKFKFESITQSKLNITKNQPYSKQHVKMKGKNSISPNQLKDKSNMLHSLNRNLNNNHKVLNFLFKLIEITKFRNL